MLVKVEQNIHLAPGQFQRLTAICCGQSFSAEYQVAHADFLISGIFSARRRIASRRTINSRSERVCSHNRQPAKAFHNILFRAFGGQQNNPLRGFLRSNFDRSTARPGRQHNINNHRVKVLCQGDLAPLGPSSTPVAS